jgi:hypothetical protein
MQVVLEVDAATEAKVRELAGRGDYSAAKRELEGPLDAAVRRLAGPPEDSEARELSYEEFRRLGDELIRVFTESLPPDAKPLPPEALTREGIYGDHP